MGGQLSRGFESLGHRQQYFELSAIARCVYDSRIRACRRARRASSAPVRESVESDATRVPAIERSLERDLQERAGDPAVSAGRRRTANLSTQISSGSRSRNDAPDDLAVELGEHEILRREACRARSSSPRQVAERRRLAGPATSANASSNICSASSSSPARNVRSVTPVGRRGVRRDAPSGPSSRSTTCAEGCSRRRSGAPIASATRSLIDLTDASRPSPRGLSSRSTSGARSRSLGPRDSGWTFDPCAARRSAGTPIR